MKHHKKKIPNENHSTPKPYNKNKNKYFEKTFSLVEFQVLNLKPN
jgi:hypothetical protein